MMKNITDTGLILLAVSLPLLAGCRGAGGLSGLFGGGSGGEILASLGSSGSSGGSSGGDVVDTSAAFDSIASSADAATLTNPEPASMALFGGGLAGLACLRRRRAKKSTS